MPDKTTHILEETLYFLWDFTGVDKLKSSQLTGETKNMWRLYFGIAFVVVARWELEAISHAVADFYFYIVQDEPLPRLPLHPVPEANTIYMRYTSWQKT